MCGGSFQYQVVIHSSFTQKCLGKATTLNDQRTCEDNSRVLLPPRLIMRGIIRWKETIVYS